MKIKKIGVMTGGGDCPGLNAVIRAVTKKALIDHNITALGFLDGFRGMVLNNHVDLTYDYVSNILSAGGTILGSSNRDNPFSFYYDNEQKEPLDMSDHTVEVCKNHELDALICIGGDGTLTLAHMLSKKGINVIGVPKTIDNDVQGTDQTFGFDSAVNTATFAIDRIRSTAESHHRAMVIELMGRTAGWLTLFAGIASGGDIILIPEIEFSIDGVCEHVKKRSKIGRRYSIICVSEGAGFQGKEFVQEEMDKRSGMVRLGGIGKFLAHEIEEKTSVEARTTVLGHLQRGGAPTPYDRILATRYGARAVELAVDNIFDETVCLRGNSIEHFPLEQVANNPRLVPADSEFIDIARSVGTYMGD